MTCAVDMVLQVECTYNPPHSSRPLPLDSGSGGHCSREDNVALLCKGHHVLG